MQNGNGGKQTAYQKPVLIQSPSLVLNAQVYLSLTHPTHYKTKKKKKTKTTQKTERKGHVSENRKREQEFVRASTGIPTQKKNASLVILISPVQTLHFLWPTGSKVHSPSPSIRVKQSSFLQAGHRKDTMTVAGLPAEKGKNHSLKSHSSAGLKSSRPARDKSRMTRKLLNLEMYRLVFAKQYDQEISDIN